jgi:toxin CptA
MGELGTRGVPLVADAPYYTDDELDALYERDPLAAMRISRRQHELRHEIDAAKLAAGPPTPHAVEALLEQARAILRRDGGNLELVAIDGEEITVRMTGNCAGCPRSALDLKNVVERLVRSRFPQIKRVRREG